MPKKSNPANNPEKKEKHRITDADLAETRAKILNAADEVESQLQIKIKKIENWKEITRSYPIELITGIFATGFVFGSGMIGETIHGVLMPSKSSKKDSKKRRSLPRRLIGLVGKTGTLAAVPAAIIYLKKQRKQATP